MKPMRKIKITIGLKPETMEKVRKVREKIGIPISVQLEKAVEAKLK